MTDYVLPKGFLEGGGPLSIVETPSPIRGDADFNAVMPASLTVSLFCGTDKIQEKLVKNVPQSCPVSRRLLWLAVIHEADEAAGVYDAKVMLYQDVGDLNHLWIRKENVQGAEGRTGYSETEHKDAIDALGGFERSVRGMLDRLVDKRRTDRLDHSVATMKATS